MYPCHSNMCVGNDRLVAENCFIVLHFYSFCKKNQTCLAFHNFICILNFLTLLRFQVWKPMVFENKLEQWRGKSCFSCHSMNQCHSSVQKGLLIHTKHWSSIIGEKFPWEKKSTVLFLVKFLWSFCPSDELSNEINKWTKNWIFKIQKR